MAKFDMKELTKEQIAKAMECETAEKLMAFVKAEGYELTRDEAESCLEWELGSEELSDFAAAGTGADAAAKKERMRRILGVFP